MSDEFEFNISELRRKKHAEAGEAGDSSSAKSNGHTHAHAHANGANTNGAHAHGDDINGGGRRFSEQETWARPMASDEPAEPRTERRLLNFSEPARTDEEALNLPFDPLRLLDALKRNWFWCFLGAAVIGGLGLSWIHFGQKAQVQVQLVRRESPPIFRATEGSTSEGYAPPKLIDQAMVSLLQSPEMVRRVCSKATTPITPLELAKKLVIYADRDAEMVNIIFKGKAEPQHAVEWVNLYATEAVEATRDMQGKEAKSMGDYFGEKLITINQELASIGESLQKIPANAPALASDRQTEAYLTQLADLETKYELLKIDAEVNNPINDKLQIARDELADMLLKYTDEHPFIQRQKEKVKTLETQAETSKGKTAPSTAEEVRANNTHMLSAPVQKQSLARQADQLKNLIERTKAKLTAVPGQNNEGILLRNRHQSLERIRTTLSNRQKEAEFYQESAPGYYTILHPATLERVFTRGHVKKSLMFALFGAIFGFLAVAGLVLAKELFDDCLKTPADLERATGLPVLGTLGDLDKMDEKAKKAWAFRTWTIIKGKLTPSQNHGFVCGFISAHHGEGRSTWVKLLVTTANERGLRVLRISTKPTDDPSVHPHEPLSPEEKGAGIPRAEIRAGAIPCPDKVAEPAQLDPSDELYGAKVLAPSALAFPAQVMEELNNPDNSSPIVHIPLPGWVWNLERRKQWQNALDHWKKIDDLVLLVELPPACEPESVLLAEKVPQMVWLSESGEVTLKETREHLETLRHAGCNLVGTVLNREPKSFFRSQIARWFGIALLISGLSTSSVQAEDTNDTAEATLQTGNKSFFVNNQAKRAPWQEKLTLGPGDVLNLGFFGETNLTKNDVAIGPDGRLSYLQATDVMAAGLTVDELRAALDKELSKYYRAPRSMVTPVQFRSKKYYVLGKVNIKGVFTLDRPITLLEAVANARGLESGVMNRNSVDLADLQRSFLIRQGQRVPIDFEKLFYHGDLSQNVPLEPDDFLYFPPLLLKEVYVVGEVAGPGVMAYTSSASTTLMAAIANRGGFSNRAYKSRVLVVRGSLQNPETFVVNTHDIVDGKMPDFTLKPKDIVYVSSRPFIKAEELLDLAATGFIQGAVTAWTGQYIGPFIKTPIVSGLYRNR